MAVQLPKKSSALPWPALVPLGHHAGKPPISLQKMVMLVGSRHNAHLHLMSRHVSKAHALILSYGGSVYIRDLASREHVYVNGTKQREAWLRNGDLIKIGSFTFKFKAGPPKVKAGADEPTDRVDLEIDGAEAPLSVAEKVMLIGRRPTCDVSLTEDSVSTAHAVIFHVAGKRYLRDLGSRTGTFVNGKKIHQQELNPGDTIRIGETDLRYALADEHAHHIEPVGAEGFAEAGGGGEVDELEHLVGTAPLDMAAEMRRDGEVVPTDEALDHDLHAVAADDGARGTDELSPDDLIELDLAPEPPAIPVADDGPIAIDEPEAVRADELSVTAPADVGGAVGGASSSSTARSAKEPADADFVEIDLSADPDVADLPQSASASDTRALDLSPARPAPKPTLSQRVVDELPAEEPAGGAVGRGDEELIPLDDEPAATGAADPGHDEVISPRGGWQRMSRVEDDTLAGELDAPLSDAEKVSEDAAIPAPAEAVAPAVEEDALVDWALDEIADTPFGSAGVEQAPPETVVAPHVPAEAPGALEDDSRSVVEETFEETPVTPAVDEALAIADETPAIQVADAEIAPPEPDVAVAPADQVVTWEAEVAPEPAAADVAAAVSEPEAAVADATFDSSAVAAPEESAQTVTVPATVPATEPVVGAGTPVEPVVAETPVAEVPVVEAPVVADVPPVEPAVSEVGVAEVPVAEPEAFVAPVVAPEPGPVEENFGKKGRARKGGGKAKGEKKVVVAPAVKEKPAKGKGGRKPRKGVAAAAAAAHAMLDDAGEGGMGTTGVVVGAGIVGAAIVAERVSGEETNVVAAGQGATADAAGDVAAVAESGAQAVIAPVEDAVVAPVADDETLVGAVPPDTAELSAAAPQSFAEVELALSGDDGEADRIEVLPVSEADAPTMSFDAGVADEGAALATAAAAEPLEGGDVRELVLDGAELTVTEPAPAEDVAPFEVPAESVQSVTQAGAEVLAAPIEPLDLNESGATWAPEADGGGGGADELSDSTFGRQMEAFTETTTGDVVEADSTPASSASAGDLEDVEDADEALAIALGGAAGSTEEAVAEEPGLVSWATGEEDLEADDNTNVTAGGIEPLVGDVVADGHLSAEPTRAEPLGDQQFEANGEAVELDTPGLAEADAVLGGQEFVAEADEAHDVRESVTEDMGSQSFEALSTPDEVKEVAPRPEPVVPPQAPQPPQQGGGGNAGGFVIGTDLSSFIGGMPLVLPELPPQPSGFGQVQVSFAGAKAPWQQAQRPAFPMGKSLAQEVMDAAEGLRDVESMDAELAVQEDAAATPEQEIGEESYTDDGAPGDEWNVAAVLEDEDEPVSAEWHAAEHTGEVSAVLPEQAPESEAAHQDSLADVSDGDVGEAPGGEELLQEIELSGGFGLNDRDDLSAAAQEIELSGGFGLSDRDQLSATAEELAAGEGEELSEAQLLEITGDQNVLDQPLPEAQSATEAPAVDDGASGFEVEAPADEFQEITIDELEFDEPAAVEDEAEGLAFDDGATPQVREEPIVDRSPPPPLAPLPPLSKKGVKPAAAPPPPPAKGGAGRGRAAATPEAPRSLTGAPPEDAIFGSLEHGKVSGAAFGGAGVREVDVFATPSAPEVDEVEGFGEGDAIAKTRPGNGEAAHVPTARRATRVIVPPKMDAIAPSPATGMVRSGGGGNRAMVRAGAAGPKKSAAGRVTWIVLLMLLSMGLAVGGIFYFMKVKQQSIGELHFQNVGALTKKQRNDLRQEQFDYLASPNVRMTARGYVQAKGLPLGFLEPGADPESEAARRASVHPGGLDDRTAATMTVEYAGTDPLDKVRVHALLMALYQENSSKVNEAMRLNSEIGKLEQKLKEYKQVKDRHEALKQVVDAAPTPETMAQLDAAVKEADAAYDAATRAVKDAQLEVRRAEEQLPGSPGEALIKSAGDGGNRQTPADKELADLQQKLEETATRAAELKGAASAEADAKRKMLDQAVEAFQQTAATLMGQNPQLAQYVQAVQQLQEKTHKLGGDLIEVQQQQHKRLSALKKDMDEQVLARRQEIWAADKGLADLRAQLDLANRKYNAARDQGFTDDSREVKDALSEIKDLTARTETRKNELGKDPIVTKVADALQELIGITKERLDADRARIEKDIKDQEQAFAESGMIERLPAQQQQQAKALEEKQKAISDLRKQYADALDRRTAESNAALRDLDSEVTSIRGRIDERKRVLAQEGAKNLTQQQEAERRTLLERKQVALKKAEDRLNAAQRVFVDRNKALRNATLALNEGAAARQEKEAIEQALPAKDQEAQYAKLDLDERRDKLQRIVKVEEPRESDVRVVQGRDDRMMYSLGAVMGLAILFGIGAVLSVMGGERRSRVSAAGEFDDDGDGDDGSYDGGPMAIHEIGARDEEEAEHSRY